MRRLHKYCLKRDQVKLSWNPRNCYNLHRWQPLVERNLNIFQIEWKSKAQCRLFFNGDVTDSIFKRTFYKCGKDMNATIESMEKRADNILFRSMFASSIYSARKMINSGFVTLNGNKIRHPNQRLSEGDVLQIVPKFSFNTHSLISHPFARLWSFLPRYIDVSYSSLTSTLIQKPTFSEVPHPFTPTMISNWAAFYSKR